MVDDSDVSVAAIHRRSRAPTSFRGTSTRLRCICSIAVRASLERCACIASCPSRSALRARSVSSSLSFASRLRAVKDGTARVVVPRASSRARCGRRRGGRVVVSCVARPLVANVEAPASALECTPTTPVRARRNTRNARCIARPRARRGEWHSRSHTIRSKTHETRHLVELILEPLEPATRVVTLDARRLQLGLEPTHLITIVARNQ